jgi:hypothetical protein
MIEADQKIEELLESDPLGGGLETWPLWFCKCPRASSKLANTVVPRGYVNQHVEAAKRAVEEIRRRSLRRQP